MSYKGPRMADIKKNGFSCREKNEVLGPPTTNRQGRGGRTSRGGETWSSMLERGGTNGPKRALLPTTTSTA